MGTGASRVVLRKVDYIGAHPNAPGELSRIDVAFEADAVTFSRRREQLGSIPWQNVKGLSAFSEAVHGKSSFLGVLLFESPFRQRGRRNILSVEDGRGAWLFEVPGIKLVDLREGLAKIRMRHDL